MGDIWGWIGGVVVAVITTWGGGRYMMRTAHRAAEVSERAAEVTADAQRAAAAISAEPLHREQDRANFEAITAHLEARANRNEQRVQALEAEVAELKGPILRYLRKALAALRLHDVPAPVPDPGDEVTLARHGFP